MPKFKVRLHMVESRRSRVDLEATVIVEAPTMEEAETLVKTLIDEEDEGISDIEWTDADEEIVGSDYLEGPEITRVFATTDDAEVDFPEEKR